MILEVQILNFDRTHVENSCFCDTNGVWYDIFVLCSVNGCVYMRVYENDSTLPEYVFFINNLDTPN